MSWKTFSIGDIAEVVTKGTTPTTYGMPFTDDGVNFIKAEALNGDVSLDRSGFTFISEDTHEKLKRSQLEPNDVLITIAGANVGKCGIVREEDLPANTNQAVGIIRVKPKLANPRFVYYHFKNPSVFSICQNFGGQAAQPNINLSILKNVKIKLPSLDFQKRIIGYISSYEDLIRNNRRRIQLLEESARLLYKEWFVHLRFPGHEHVKIVDGVPEGWEKRRVQDFGNVITGKTPSTKDIANFGDEIPFIKTPDLHTSSIVIFPEEYLSEKGSLLQRNKLLPPNSILIACIGAKLGVVSLNGLACQTNQQINAVVPSDIKWTYYIFFTLQSFKDRLLAIGGGATMPNVSKNKFESMEVVFPAQNLIDNFYLAVKSNFDQIKTLIIMNKKLESARDLLLPRLMNGELTL